VIFNYAWSVCLAPNSTPKADLPDRRIARNSVEAMEHPRDRRKLGCCVIRAESQRADISRSDRSLTRSFDAGNGVDRASYTFGRHPFAALAFGRGFDCSERYRTHSPNLPEAMGVRFPAGTSKSYMTTFGRSATVNSKPPPRRSLPDPYVGRQSFAILALHHQLVFWRSLSVATAKAYRLTRDGETKMIHRPQRPQVSRDCRRPP
jgi:hypothetical protein